MLSDSLKLNEKKCKFKIEKRNTERVKFELEVFYPRVNNESVYENYKAIRGPLMEASNISQGGIGFKSHFPVNTGDFISFLLKIGNAVSSECIVVVRWVGFGDDCYLVGCEFVSLSFTQMNQIKNYIDNAK